MTIIQKTITYASSRKTHFLMADIKNGTLVLIQVKWKVVRQRGRRQVLGRKYNIGCLEYEFFTLERDHSGHFVDHELDGIELEDILSWSCLSEGSIKNEYEEIGTVSKTFLSLERYK